MSLCKFAHFCEKESKARKTGTCYIKLILNLMSKPLQELIHITSNVFCTFNLTFFTSNTLREGIFDIFIKQGPPVPSSTSPLNSSSDTT